MSHEEKESKPPVTLDTITLDTYQDIPQEIREWLTMNEDVPPVMWEKLKDLDPRLSLRQVLERIKGVFSEACGEKSSRPDGFEESRFTSFAEIIKRGLNSCGVRVRVYGTTLRKLGIPVRFIDGTHTEGSDVYEHAWLAIYVPSVQKWLESDPGLRSFGQDPHNHRERVFHDWEELKARYEEK